MNNLQYLLEPVVRAASEVYTDIPLKPSPTSTFSRFFSNPSAQSDGIAKVLESSKIKPLKSIINDIRVYKSEAEIANMRRAGQASGRAFTEAMRHHWTREKDLAAFLDYRFKIQGCDTSAYVPVVAGGQVRSAAGFGGHTVLTGEERTQHPLRPKRRYSQVSPYPSPTISNPS